MITDQRSHIDSSLKGWGCLLGGLCGKGFEIFSVLHKKEFLGRCTMSSTGGRWECYTLSIQVTGYTHSFDYLSHFLIIKFLILHSWCYDPYYFMRQLKSIIPQMVDGTKRSDFLLAQHHLSLSVFKLWPVASLPAHQ